MGNVNAAQELLNRNLHRHPDKTAYFCGADSISYRQLDEASRRFAMLLRDRGIMPGERVMMVLPDTFAFPISFLGSLLAGVIAVPVSTVLGVDDYLNILEDSGARLLVTH